MASHLSDLKDVTLWNSFDVLCATKLTHVSFSSEMDATSLDVYM